MKYAVVEAGGKQYVAREGEAIEVDRLDLQDGKSLEFKEVLFLVDGKSIWVGQPLVKGAGVKAKVVAEVKAPKVIVYRYKPKVRQRVKRGHRQKYTRIMIESIQAPGKEAPGEAPLEKAAAKGKAPAAEKGKPVSAKPETAPKRAPAAARRKAAEEKEPTKASPSKKKAAPAKEVTGTAARPKKPAVAKKTTGAEPKPSKAAPKKTTPKKTTSKPSSRKTASKTTRKKPTEGK